MNFAKWDTAVRLYFAKFLYFFFKNVKGLKPNVLEIFFNFLQDFHKKNLFYFYLRQFHSLFHSLWSVYTLYNNFTY